MSWIITSEYHVSPPARDPKSGKVIPPVDFFYAIRRIDGSLLFRTGKLDDAEEILGRLAHTHSPAFESSYKAPVAV